MTPFEVICIARFGGRNIYNGAKFNLPMPVKGNKYTVIGTDVYGNYELAELPVYPAPNKRASYVHYKFRKLDDNFGHQIAERIEKTFIKPLIPVEYE